MPEQDEGNDPGLGRENEFLSGKDDQRRRSKSLQKASIRSGSARLRHTSI